MGAVLQHQGGVREGGAHRCSIAKIGGVFASL
jgi:hypothetical protein